MSVMIFAVVATFTFLHLCWQQLKRDAGVKTFYTWEELEAQDRLKAEKWEARKLALKKLFGIK